MATTRTTRTSLSYFSGKDDDPHIYGARALRTIYAKAPIMVTSPNWGGLRNTYIRGIGHSQTFLDDLQQFRIAGVSCAPVSPGTPTLFNALHLVSAKPQLRDANFNVSEPHRGVGSGSDALRVGDSKALAYRGIGHDIYGETVVPGLGTHSLLAMLEALGKDFSEATRLPDSRAYMVHSRRPIPSDPSWTFVRHAEDDQVLPSVISFRESSETRTSSISFLMDYASRIQKLRSLGEEEDIAISRDSVSDFWRFMIEFPSEEPGHLVLMQDGHLRWIWKGDDRAHIGIRFIGSGRGRYVIFKRRSGEFQVSRVSGEDNLEGVVQQVRSFDMTLFSHDRNQAD